MAFVASTIPFALHAKPATYELAPSSKWWMDYAPDSCSLSRAFGAGKERVVAQFIRYEPSAGFDLHLASELFSNSANLPDLRLRFGASGDFVRAGAMSGTTGPLPALFLHGRLDNLDLHGFDHEQSNWTPEQRAALAGMDPAVESAVNSATLIFRNKTVVLRLGGMRPPMVEMRKCTTDLVKLWGLDPEQQEGRSSQPIPKSNPGYWLASSDYPLDSLAKGEQAIIRFRLMVDAAGQPTQCAVQAAIARGDFARITCDLLKRRARFQPAKASDGQAISSYYVNSVRWIIP